MESLTKNQILAISNEIYKKLPTLLAYFDIDYVQYPNRYAFPCPVHGGDNSEACCIFTDGTTRIGNWQCWTQHCESEFHNNLFGFVRGCLSQKRDKSVSMNETAKFCSNFLDKSIDNINYSDVDKTQLKIIDIFNREIERDESKITREDIRSKLQIPSNYYINRGYLPETLDLFDVGLCAEKNKQMFNRVVVPVYDEDYNYVGCVGRSTEGSTKYKWLHSRGFKKNILYGMSIAKEHILKTSTVILVEGQGDVWRMHEAGFKNCVGIFGSSLNEDQLLLLERCGALSLVILTDSDEAGNKAYNQIIKLCGRRFNYYRPSISKKDVGDMTTEQINEELSPQLKGIF
jgi:DNA primase